MRGRILGAFAVGLTLGAIGFFGSASATLIRGDPAGDTVTAAGSNPQFACSLATATCELDSATNPATASTTVADFTFKSPAGLKLAATKQSTWVGGDGGVQMSLSQGGTLCLGPGTDCIASAGQAQNATILIGATAAGYQSIYLGSALSPFPGGSGSAATQYSIRADTAGQTEINSASGSVNLNVGNVAKLTCTTSAVTPSVQVTSSVAAAGVAFQASNDGAKTCFGATTTGACATASGTTVTFGGGVTVVANVTGANFLTGTNGGVYAATFNPTMRTLGTCAVGVEGQLEADVLSGAATGKATKLCLCRSDGASTYKWQNLATGTLGTTTTCGTE